MSAAAPANEPKQRLCLAPLPTTRRGYGIQLYAHPLKPYMIYTNGKLVVVRNIQNPSESWTFSEHKANVTVAQFSPSGFWVASGDDEGNVIIWSWPQMKVKNTVRVGKTIMDLDWDIDNQRVVAVGDGAQGKAKVFTVDSGNNVGEILMHNLAIITCSYRKQRPFRIVTGSEDLTVNYYEGPPFKYVQNFKGHTRYPNCIRFSPNGEYFLSVGADSKICLFEGKSGAPIKEFEGKHEGSILSFSWSPDSTRILTASADRTAKIISIPSGDVQTTFTFGENVINDQQVAALWKDEYLITVSLSGAINYLNPSTPNKPARVLHGHQTTIQSISFDQKNGFFYTSALSGEIAKWDVKSGDAVWLSGIGHAGRVVTQVNVNASSDSLFSFGLDDRGHVSSLAKGEVNQDGVDLGGKPDATAASPKDPKVAVAALAQNKLVVLRDDRIVHSLPLSYQPTAVAFNVDGTEVIVGGKDKKLRVYSFDGAALKSSPVWEGGEHDKPISWIDVSRDGKWIVSSDKEASIYIRSSTKFDVKNRNGWRFHQASVQSVSFSPNGQRLASGSLDTAILLWHNFNDFSADRIKIDRAHPSGVEHVRFWDDTTLISVGADRTIKIWDVPPAK